MDIGISKSRGIVVFVHEPETSPDFSDGILISPGTETNLAITQTNHNRLG